MKKMMIAFLIFSSSYFAQAKDFEVKKVCEPGPGRLAFSEKMRDEVVEQFKSIAPNTDKWKKFEESEMFQWILLTYPEVLPSQAARPVAESIAAPHIQFLAAPTNEEAQAKLNEWKDAMTSAYRETPPSMFTKLIECYSSFKPNK